MADQSQQNSLALIPGNTNTGIKPNKKKFKNFQLTCGTMDNMIH